MKSCQCCGAKHAADQVTCSVCGEASWSVVVTEESAATEATNDAASTAPTKRSAKAATASKD